MSRWIVFDQATADAVQESTGNSVELHDGSEVETANVVALAIAAPGPSVALLASGSEHTLVMRFTRRSRPQAAAQPHALTTRTAPAGFLGLSDEIVLDDQAEAPKKWWQKILD